ncbi:MAG: adenylate/guanylate cyclase domain-containing protein [Actinomycetota bacterium]|nr:adenylate/guanylate cyclase domain-containing protein [Actinomycetota bacterium]
MEIETRYAKSGETHIAYRMLGQGPPDLIYVPGTFSHVEFAWEEPSYARFLRRLASFGRLVMLDLRGVGLSDRGAVLPTLEDQMDDVTAVLDAICSDEAVILGVSQGGPTAALYAATYPQRTAGLILYGAYATAVGQEDHPWGRTPQWVDRYVARADTDWGRGMHLAEVAPSRVDDEAFARWWARLERYACAPGNAMAFIRAHSEDDVRHVLSAISAPTLVLQRADDQYRDPRNAKFLAHHIAGARWVELPGRDHLPYVGDQDSVLDEIEELLTGVPGVRPADRVLATVLFTDIVASTERAAELGDRRWGEVLDLHHATVRRELDRYRGREVDTAGDGFVATFDGPARAIRCALDIRHRMRALDLEIRAGLHTGEVEVAGSRVVGIAVHIGARVAALAAPGEVLVSRTVKDLVGGSGIDFDDRGAHSLKGVPEEWQLYAVR